MATSTEAGSTSQSQHDTESASSQALSQRSDQSENEEEDGRSQITQKWLLSFFSKDWKHYYRTFELNEKLYLHFKGKQSDIHVSPPLPELLNMNFFEKVPITNYNCVLS